MLIQKLNLSRNRIWLFIFQIENPFEIWMRAWLLSLILHLKGIGPNYWFFQFFRLMKFTIWFSWLKSSSSFFCIPNICCWDSSHFRLWKDIGLSPITYLLSQQIWNSSCRCAPNFQSLAPRARSASSTPIPRNWRENFMMDLPRPCWSL